MYLKFHVHSICMCLDAYMHMYTDIYIYTHKQNYLHCVWYYCVLVEAKAKVEER